MIITPQSALEPLIAAVYTVLNTSGLTGIATNGVYNEPPQGTKPPYVVIRTPTENPQNTLQRPGSECLVSVESVSSYPGDREVVRMASKVRQLLDKNRLTVSGYTVSQCSWESNVPDDDVVDGVHYRYMTSLFRVKLEQTS